LKICCIAGAAQALAQRQRLRGVCAAYRSVFLILIDGIPKIFYPAMA
jgi:hypothetical protein